jgi:hypothetical protein
MPTGRVVEEKKTASDQKQPSPSMKEIFEKRGLRLVHIERTAHGHMIFVTGWGLGLGEVRAETLFARLRHFKLEHPSPKLAEAIHAKREEIISCFRIRCDEEMKKEKGQVIFDPTKFVIPSKEGLMTIAKGQPMERAMTSSLLGTTVFGLAA